MRFVRLLLLLSLSTFALAPPAAATSPGGAPELAAAKLHRAHGSSDSPSAPTQPVTRNFEILGHADLGGLDSNGDVWVHGNFAYVGTWADPCTGRGVKIVDVSDLRHPTMIGAVAARPGTSAEDVVVRHVQTDMYSGDLLAAGIQKCSSDETPDDEFGVEFWDVSTPGAPVKLSELGVTHGDAGVHELDLFQRGSKVYALLATPFTEFFDPVPGGDFRIVDVTNPRLPVQVGEWGAAAHGLTPGPFFGQGSFGASFDHSARASADGTKAYVSYWDLGVLTLDISDVSNPTLVGRTRYKPTDDGDAHSVTEYRRGKKLFLLQNDEDFDPRSPALVRFRGGKGLATESPGGAPLWLEPNHRVKGDVVAAANQGCEASDYPASTAGRIAVVRTPFPFFEPDGGEEPLCLQGEQAQAAAAAGAKAVVHDFIASATSPQWFDFADPAVGIPVLFTDHATAQGMVAAGRARLKALEPSWGFLRVFNAATGKQVAKFDRAANVHALPPPEGFWSIHNTEVVGNRAYSSWYSNGIVALNLKPLGGDDGENPRLVGQFVPPGGESPTPFNPSGVAIVWGVAIRSADNVIFASDMNSGLWIVRPTGRAAP